MAIFPDRAPENDARLLHGRSDDVRIVAFLRRALVEEIAVGAPRFQSRFHRRERRSPDRRSPAKSGQVFIFSPWRRFPAPPTDRCRATTCVVFLLHAIARRSTESRSVPFSSKIAAFGNSKSSVVEASKAATSPHMACLRHTPVEVRPAIVPPCWTAFAECPVDLVSAVTCSRLKLFSNGTNEIRNHVF